MLLLLSLTLLAGACTGLQVLLVGEPLGRREGGSKHDDCRESLWNVSLKLDLDGGLLG